MRCSAGLEWKVAGGSADPSPAVLMRIGRDLGSESRDGGW